MQSVIATQQAAEKLLLHELQRAERAELAAKFAPLPQYKRWKEQPQIVGQKIQPLEQPLMLIDHYIVRDQQPKRLSQIVHTLTHTKDARGHVTYKSAGIEVFRDEGKLLTVLDQSSQSIAATLAVAQMKFGQTLTLTGDDAFKRRSVAAAVDYNLTCKFSDPLLEDLRLKLTEEKQLAERKAMRQVERKVQARNKERQQAANEVQDAAHTAAPASQPQAGKAALSASEEQVLSDSVQEALTDKQHPLSSFPDAADPAPNQQYFGKVLLANQSYLVLSGPRGEKSTLHILSPSAHMPSVAVGDQMAIKYRAGEMINIVNETRQSRDKGKGR